MIGKKTVSIGIYMISIMFLLNCLTNSCRKPDEFNTSGSFKLEFSKDTILFDTIFATTGSATRSIKVYNKSNKEVNISSIQVDGGMQSWYQINVDGASGNLQKNIEIPANDSIFIFANITINPNDESAPFIVEDKLKFQVNGNQQEVILQAWGQNANYIVADEFIRMANNRKLKYKVVAKEGETVYWTKEKPYLIYGGFATILGKGKLIIEKGTKIYCHSNSGIWSYIDGALEINGTIDEPVTIQGDRLSGSAKDYAGQWDRIWILQSNYDSKINYAIIKNGAVGLQAEVLPTGTTDPSQVSPNHLFVKNTIIENNTLFNLVTRAYQIQAQNLVFGNAGAGSIWIQRGGDYDFRQITLGNYWRNASRPNGSVIVNNYYQTSDAIVQTPIKLFYGNSILYGNHDDEIIFDTVTRTAAKVDIKFQNCLLRTKQKIVEFPDNYIDCIANMPPLFVGQEKDIDPEDQANFYELQAESPAIEAGNPDIGASVPLDIKGISRVVPKPDLGAYQHQGGER